jgi:hypothetical protein
MGPESGETFFAAFGGGIPGDFIDGWKADAMLARDFVEPCKGRNASSSTD